jgi:hypothetical protein
MRSLIFTSIATCILTTISGCGERRAAKVTRDACSLVSKEEVESIQASPVTEAKSSRSSNGDFLVSQCFYTAAEFSKSVTLALIRKDPTQRNSRSPKDFWKEKFGERERDEKSEGKTAESEGPAPKRISGLGDDAYWLSNRFGGILYVLEGDAFMSIGLGGTDDEQSKLEKSKQIAQKALERL